jgi:fatty-acyl-CoA synthase
MDAPARAPHPRAEIVSRRVEGDLHRLTGAELVARVRRVAGALAAAGLAPGEAVAAIAWNGHRHVELALACAAGGIRIASLDPGQPNAIVRVADEACARLVFFDLSFMPLVESIASRLALARAFVALAGRADMPGPPAIPSLLCYEELVDDAAEVAASAPAIPTARFDLRPEDVVLAGAPMFDRDGSDLVRAALAEPVRRLVLPGPWLDGRSLHEMIAGEGVTVAAASPKLWQRLLAHAEREGTGLAELRRALVTGDPDAAGAVARALRDRHGVSALEATPHPLCGWGAEAGQAPVVSR